jgi:hypothetical protein
MNDKTIVSIEVNCNEKEKQCSDDILHNIISGSLKIIKNELIMEVEYCEYDINQ